MKNRNFLISVAAAILFVVSALLFPARERVKEPEFVFPKLNTGNFDSHYYLMGYSIWDRPYFRVAYIGKPKEEISLDQRVVVCMQIPLLPIDTVPPYEKPEVIKGNPRYTDIKRNSSFFVPFSNTRNVLLGVHVYIDTTHNLAKQLPRALQYMRIYPVLLHNTSAHNLLIGENDEITLDVQQLENGNWKTLFSSRRFGCGNGRENFFLPPGEIAVTALTLPNERSEKYRLVAGATVSNTFR